MSKRALIIGISGQDGAFLSEYLVRMGYDVWGTSRDADKNSFLNLRKLDVLDSIKLSSMDIEDFRSILSVINKVQPDEIYSLGGQTSVGLSYEQPSETINSISLSTLNLLEVARIVDFCPRMYFAGSSECFGDTGGTQANELTPFRPQSPYAIAKASAYWLVENYREAYGIWASTGILFNHESELRHPRFVTQKIVSAALRIKAGEQDSLELGRIDIVRDWGHAEEYVRAMWLMLQQKKPDDYVISTGKPNSLAEFVEEVFFQLDMDWRKYVKVVPELSRPLDIGYSCGNPQKASDVLGWSAKLGLTEIVDRMISC